MASRASAVLELQGRLINHAHAAQRRLDAVGQFAPTLCFEVECGAGHRRCVVEQHFQVGEEDQCQAAARQLRRGDVVSFCIDTESLLLTALGATDLHKVAPEPDMFATATAEASPARREAHA